MNYPLILKAPKKQRATVSMNKLPKGWYETTIGELVVFNYGKNLPKEKRKEGKYDVYGANGIVGYHNEAITKAPTILIGRKGSIGEIHYSDAPCFPIDTTYYVDDFNGNDPEFLTYLFRSLPLSAMNRSTAIPGLNRDDVYSLNVWLPPLSAQKRIAEKLKYLLKKIEFSKRELDYIPSLIMKYKDEILKTSFDKVNGQEVTIGELADIVTSGSRGWAKYYSQEGDLFIRVGNTKRHSIDLDLIDRQNVAPPSGSEGTRTQVHGGDILVTITADLGRVAVIPEYFEKAYVNQHIALIRLKSPDLARYVAWYIASPKGQVQLQMNNRGATKSGLRLDDIRNLKLTVPESAARSAIVKYIEAGLKTINNMAMEYASAVKLITDLEKIVISEAIRGKLTPQSKNNETAKVLLSRIDGNKDKKNKKVTRANKMSKKPIDKLMNDIENWPRQGLPFEDVATRLSMPYETLRDIIFSLLSEKKRVLHQYFNEQDNCMYLQRINE